MLADDKANSSKAGNRAETLNNSPRQSGSKLEWTCSGELIVTGPQLCRVGVAGKCTGEVS